MFLKLDNKVEVNTIKLTKIKEIFCYRIIDRVPTGHGKPGISWNFSRGLESQGKSWNLLILHAQSGNIMEFYHNCKSQKRVRLPVLCVDAYFSQR